MSKKLEHVSENESEAVENEFYSAIHAAGLNSLIPPVEVRDLDAGLPSVTIGINSLRYIISQLLKLELMKTSAATPEVKKKSNSALEQAFEECHSPIIGYTPSPMLVKDAS